MKTAIVLAFALSACAADVELELDQADQEIVATSQLAASALASAKPAAALIGGASLASNSAQIRALVSTTAGRATFGVIVGCALPLSSSVTATDLGGTMYTFPGAHSLAASWETSAPTVAQRRWVTACLMARTNVFGLSVATSLRHDTNPALQASGAEKATYSSVEAGFYGDLFAAGSPMFACASQIFAPGGNPALESIRACARSNNGFTTQCGFSYTWLCGQTLSGHAAACLDTVAPYGSCRGSAVTYAESVTLYAAP